MFELIITILAIMTVLGLISMTLVHGMQATDKAFASLNTNETVNPISTMGLIAFALMLAYGLKLQFDAGEYFIVARFVLTILCAAYIVIRYRQWASK